MQPSSGQIAERRLVSVLFADLVGFTAIAEQRDPEEVRDFLSSYFQRMREIVALHGGASEKFIGDAVVALWGTPHAHEDDAERAVRAALAMTASVEAMNEEHPLGGSSLPLRVGVLTGEAAITVGAVGEGMVAGDLVNTASRVQAVAPPGWVLVDAATRSATHTAVAYEEAGAPVLKGKSAPVTVWRALRVVGGRRGVGKSSGLEPPFVGREEEFRLVVDLFHAAVREGRARLVSVTGIAGIGKSRLAWEFEKYADGIAQIVLWHRGRCLAYGEGVTYWALADMIRIRAGITDEEPSGDAQVKLRRAIESAIPNPEERDWVEPRLAHLLGLPAPSGLQRPDLFGAWRLFLERLAGANPVVLVFEDLQWADAALLDFLEYLLDWSRNHPIYVLTLARPEFAERRPGWGVAARAFTSVTLEPLPSPAMGELIRGLVPGLPDDLVERIVQRAEGVPLFAVETIRRLLDRGLVRLEDSRYVITGDVETLEIPETLHSLVAARLDALPEAERGVIRDASVLGKTFSTQALAAVSRTEPATLEVHLASLSRKEFVSIQTDPLSPDRGQYGFLQDLVREIAYRTLSKKERRGRHLAVARYLESNWGEPEEVVQILASHYLEAYLLAPEAPDAPELQSRARGALARAGERAAALAAPAEARRYFERAMDLADSPADGASLRARAGEMAWADGDARLAAAYWEAAIPEFESIGGTREAAKVSARLAQYEWSQGNQGPAIQRMQSAYGVLAAEGPDEALAPVAAELARLSHFQGEQDRARGLIDTALGIAESHDLPDVMATGLMTKALIVAGSNFEEGFALHQHALTLALEGELYEIALRGYNNLWGFALQGDRVELANETVARGLALARRLGDRSSEWAFIGKQGMLQYYRGEWDVALETLAGIPSPTEASGSVWPYGGRLWYSALIHGRRMELEEAEEQLSSLERLYVGTPDLQNQVAVGETRTIALAAGGDLRSAVDCALEVLEVALALGDLGPAPDYLAAGLDAAFELEDLAAVDEFIKVSERSPHISSWVRGQIARSRARLAAAGRLNIRVEPEFKSAEARFTKFGDVFWLAVARLQHGEWLVQVGEADRAAELIEQARGTLERLRAQPWLDEALGLARLTRQDA